MTPAQIEKHFFNPSCDRCGEKNSSFTMSRFNTDNLCEACDKSEKKHPDYAHAAAVELDHVKRGNYNFEGIGWPGVNGRVALV